MLVLKILSWIVLVLVIWRITAGIIRKLVHFPAPSFISIFFDSRIRGLMQPPEDIIRYSGIRPGKNVLEIGCGSGFFTIPAAAAAGSGGKVIALDVQPEMLDKLEAKLRKDKYSDISNIRPVMASACEIPYPAETFDVVFTVSALQEIPEPYEALLEAHRVLKENGLMSVSEFFPDPDWPLPSTVEKQLESAGFRNIRRYGNLLRYTITGEK